MGVSFLKETVLEKLLNKTEFISVSEESRLKKYNVALQELKQREIAEMHILDIIKIIKESDKLNLLIDELREMREELLFASLGHGATHCERVTILAFVIGVFKNLIEEDFKILLESTKYHDIGRIDDNEDEFHGRRSANQFDEYNIGEGFSKEDKNILKAICVGHSIDDKEFENIMQEFNIEEKEKCIRLFEILKDAVALDRVSLKYSEEEIQALGVDDSIIDLNYLRTNYYKMMIPAAYELYENYQNEIELYKNLLK